MRYIGVHLSIAGGVYRAFEGVKDLSINAFQMFLKSSNRWQDKPYKKEDIDKFKDESRNYPGVRIYAHSAYLINPAADDTPNKQKSLAAIIDELERASKLEIDWIVLHPGSHKGTGVDSGIERAVTLLDKAFLKAHSEAGILLETTAGQGNALGSSFEDIARIIDESKNPGRFGVCLDTCHVFTAGYDFTTHAGTNLMVSEFDKIIGLNKLRLIHVNDSKYEAGSNKDRHEHIGKGKIGEEGLKILLSDKRLESVPLILETPKDDDTSDKKNLEKVMKMLS